MYISIYNYMALKVIEGHIMFIDILEVVFDTV